MRKILLWTVMGLATIMVLIIGVSALQMNAKTSREKKTATTFVNEVLAGDSTNSYTSFSSAAQKSQSKDLWATQVSKLSNFFRGTTPTLQKVTNSGTKTMVTYTITGSDGKYTMTVTMVSSKSGLQIESFTSLLTLS